MRLPSVIRTNQETQSEQVEVPEKQVAGSGETMEQEAQWDEKDQKKQVTFAEDDSVIENELAEEVPGKELVQDNNQPNFDELINEKLKEENALLQEGLNAANQKHVVLGVNWKQEKEKRDAREGDAGEDGAAAGSQRLLQQLFQAPRRKP